MMKTNLENLAKKMVEQTVADQIRELELKSCPQTILRIDGNITIVNVDMKLGSKPEGPRREHHKKRVFDVANGAPIKDFHIVRHDRVSLTFEGCPNIEIGIHKNEIGIHENGGAKFYLQTKGSKFMYEVFFPKCSVILRIQNPDNAQVQAVRKRTVSVPAWQSNDANDSSIVQMMQKDKPQGYERPKREKAEQKRKDNKTVIRKAKRIRSNNDN